MGCLMRNDAQSNADPHETGMVRPLKPHSDLARNSAFSAIGGLLVSLSGLASTVIIARVLGVENAGLVAFAVWIAFTGASLADAGISTSLTRYVPELRSSGREAQGEAFAAAMFRIFGITLALAISALLLAWHWMPGTIEPKAWLLICALTAIQAFATIFTAYLKGRHQFDRLAKLSFGASLIQLVVVTAGVVSLGVNGALLGYVAGALLPGALALKLLVPKPQISPDLKRRVFSFALLNWVTAVISGIVWFRAELFFLQISWGLETVGLFSVGLALANVATLVPALLLGALLPHFSSQIGRRETREMRATYVAASRLIGLLVFPICFGAAAICPVLVPMLYGQQFAAAIPSAMIVVAGSVIGIAAATNTNVIISLERIPLMLSANVLGLLLMVVGGLAVVPHYGAEGAAVTRVVVQTVVVGVEFLYVVYWLGFEAPLAALLKAAGAALVSAGSAYLCVALVGGPASLFVAVPLGAAIYLLAIRVLLACDPSDRRLLETAALRMPAALRSPTFFCIGFAIPARSAQ